MPGKYEHVKWFGEQENVSVYQDSRRIFCLERDGQYV